MRSNFPGRFAVLALSSLAACGASAPLPSAYATQRVAIRGERADTLGETSEAPRDGHSFVRAHDGRELWVPVEDLTPPALTAGTWVLVNHEGGIYPAQILDVLDDYVEVRLADVVGFAPMHAIVAILHQPPAEPAVASTDEATDAASSDAGASP